ncbi:MAG: hypothetical protein L6W00_00060 [Lentisphaeria bacterium]|nr:MAG: hypothetical protein L6W00_00060 [Lentisphaeria bacterium]
MSLPEDRELVQSVSPEFYHRGKGTPAEFITSGLGYYNEVIRAIHRLIPERMRRDYFRGAATLDDAREKSAPSGRMRSAASPGRSRDAASPSRASKIRPTAGAVRLFCVEKSPSTPPGKQPETPSGWSVTITNTSTSAPKSRIRNSS